MNFLDRLFTFFQNKTLNALGVERDLMELIKAKDISRAMSLMEDHDVEVSKALCEYNPKSHAVWGVETKRGRDRLRTEKCPALVNAIKCGIVLPAWKSDKWKVSDEPVMPMHFATNNSFEKYDSTVRCDRLNGWPEPKPKVQSCITFTGTRQRGFLG